MVRGNGIMPLSLLCVERWFRDVWRCGVVGSLCVLEAVVFEFVVFCVVVEGGVVANVFVVVVFEEEGGRELRSGGDMVLDIVRNYMRVELLSRSR